jgi:hypothetical protein
MTPDERSKWIIDAGAADQNELVWLVRIYHPEVFDEMVNRLGEMRREREADNEKHMLAIYGTDRANWPYNP